MLVNLNTNLNESYKNFSLNMACEKYTMRVSIAKKESMKILRWP